MRNLSKLTAFLILLFLLALLGGCGQSANDYISKNFALENVQGNEKEGIQKIYRAADMSVAQVIQKIADQQKPKEQSEVKEDKAVLVYDDQVITVKKDDNKAQDSLIYVSSYQFVKNNTDSGFWKGYLTARALDVLFGGMGNRAPPYSYNGGSYKGPWDYQGSSQSGSDIKKPDGISKPSTSEGTGTVTRKSPSITPGDTSNSNSGVESSKSSSKSGSSITPYSKPKTSFGSGSVTRRSGKR